MGVGASGNAFPNDMKRAYDATDDPDEAGPSRPPPPASPTLSASAATPDAPDTECPVCCETYTRSIRKPIECPKCKYAACMTCCKKHVSTSDPAACMSCSQAWDYEFLTTNFTAAWISSEYRAHRETILVDREIAQLPASQHLVANYRASETLRTDLTDLAQEKAAISRRLHAINNEVWNKRHRLARITVSHFENNGLGDRTEAEAEEQAARTFIRACPVEDCRGFLSSALKCGTCNGWACAECLGVVGETRDAPHTCDANDVATAKLIKRDTKPCPSCATLIHKVDGCDQVRCEMPYPLYLALTYTHLHPLTPTDPSYADVVYQLPHSVQLAHGPDIPRCRPQSRVFPVSSRPSCCGRHRRPSPAWRRSRRKRHLRQPPACRDARSRSRASSPDTRERGPRLHLRDQTEIAPHRVLGDGAPGPA